jgi:hypothetical protein
MPPTLAPADLRYPLPTDTEPIRVTLNFRFDRRHLALRAGASSTPIRAAATREEIPAGEIGWSSDCIFLLDRSTGDGRRFLSTTPDGAVAWGHRGLPLPLMAILRTTWGHDDAETVGRIESIGTPVAHPRGGLAVPAQGMFADSDKARDVVYELANGNVYGCSVDLDIYEVDYEYQYDEDGWIVDGEMIGIRHAIAANTIVPHPAYMDTVVTLDDIDQPERGEPFGAAAEVPEAETEIVDDDEPEGDEGEASSRGPNIIVASSAPARPTLAQLRRTSGGETIPFTVGEPDSAGIIPVWGHMARFQTDDTDSGACHLSYLEVGLCVCCEPSAAEYSYFMSGGTVTSREGERVKVAPIALYGGHADTDPDLDWRQVSAFYDDPAKVGCYVTIVDDEIGPFVSGFVKPGLADADVIALQAASISGDWRWITDGRELVGACAVNTPGFNVTLADGSKLADLPGPHARAFGAEVRTLIAARGTQEVAAAKRKTLTPATVAELQALTARLDRTERALGELEPEIAAKLRERILASR